MYIPNYQPHDDDDIIWWYLEWYVDYGVEVCTFCWLKAAYQHSEPFSMPLNTSLIYPKSSGPLFS